MSCGISKDILLIQISVRMACLHWHPSAGKNSVALPVLFRLKSILSRSQYQINKSNIINSPIGRKEGRKKGRKEERKEWKEGRKKGRKEGRKEY